LKFESPPALADGRVGDCRLGAVDADGAFVEVPAVVGAGEDLPTFEAASPLCRDLAAERGDSGCLADCDEPLGEVEEAVAIGCRGNLVNAGPLGEDW
jgi:hypothetical protein